MSKTKKTENTIYSNTGRRFSAGSFLGSYRSKGFTLVEVLLVIVVIGILAAIATVGWNGVATSSANNARSLDVKQWSSSFDLYKSRYSSWPVLPTADGTTGAMTLCLGDFTSTGGKCGNLSGQSYSVNNTLLTAIKKVGRQPQNTAPVVTNSIVGPIAYVTRSTDAGGIATVTVQYIGFFQTTCPKDFTNVSTAQPASAILPAGSSTVACAVSSSFTYDTAIPTSPSVTPTAPVVATNAATAIGNTSATLNGTLTDVGNSDKVTVSFECGTTTSYGTNTTPQVKTTNGAFSAFVTGTSGTTYHCRAKAVGDNGTMAYGSDQSFTLTTPPPAATPPSVSTDAATDIQNTTVTLNGTLSGMGNSTSVTVSFECGTTTSYDTSVPAGSKTTAGTFTASATGTAGTTYHCRAKAVGSNGLTAYGDDVSFTMTQHGVYAQDATATTTGQWKCLGNTTQHVLMQYSPPKCSSKTTCSGTSCGPATYVTTTTYSCPAGTYLSSKKCYYN